MAKMAEQEGFDSLWVFARLLSPLKPQTPYPVIPDGSLLVQYQNVFDPIETLSFRCYKSSNCSWSRGSDCLPGCSLARCCGICCLSFKCIILRHHRIMLTNTSQCNYLCSTVYVVHTLRRVRWDAIH